MVADGVAQTVTDIKTGGRVRKRALITIFMPAPGGGIIVGLAVGKLTSVAGSIGLKFIKAAGGAHYILYSTLNQEILRYSINSLRYELVSTFNKTLAANSKVLYKIFNAKIKIGNEITNGTLYLHADNNGAVYWHVAKTSLEKYIKSQSAFKAAIEKGENVFYLGIHKDCRFPNRATGPNGIAESHHGIISAWMRKIFLDYNEEIAPTVHMLANPNHNATRSYGNKWLNAKAKELGQTFQTLDYSLISEIEIRQLSEELFDVAEVPLQIRTDYYTKWTTYKNALTPR